MPHCTKCGAEVGASVQFCQNCGQAQPAVASVPPGVSSPSPSASPVVSSGGGLTENTAATLSYVLGWLTGVIFFLIDKRPYVRFHAAQSIVVFGGLHILRIVLAMMFGVGWMFGGRHGMGPMAFGGFGLGVMLLGLIGLLTFILWIICMIKAATGVRFMVPIAAPIAENLAGK